MKTHTVGHSALGWFLVRQKAQVNRSTFKAILEQHNLAAYMPRERHIADACRMALGELSSLPPVEVGPGEQARIISAPAPSGKGEYAWDLHLQAQNRTEGQIEYPRLGQLRLKEGQVTAHLQEDMDLPLELEMALEAIFANLPAKAKACQETLDCNQIRSFLEDVLSGKRFPIRPGVFFCLASDLPYIENISTLMQQVLPNQVQFSLYRLEPTAENIQSLTTDLAGSIEDELDRIEQALQEAASEGKIGRAEARDNLSYLACLRANLDEFEGLLGFKPADPNRIANLENTINSLNTKKGA